ncbi:MAG TPA: ATP synthase F1 subunit epsilon [Oligoflexia bacterium]|nr:ATP synthase F1 subunit epsilon [Oligoflexia bacterium]HMP48165.1 ATP synthase F1 subunit epsilon [Oligoflexia bacterium]
MTQEFHVEILTPASEVLSASASEVLLPSHRGELGLLPGHENLLGLLGTGTMKVVSGGNDFWFVVSGGAFKVDSGNVTVFAEFGVAADKVDSDWVDKELRDAESELQKDSNLYNSETVLVKQKSERLLAMKEALRRHQMS